MKKIIKFIMIFSISIILVLSFSSITGFAASADNSFNGSYILSNGIIVLVDEDIDGYLTGSLIFYNPRDNEELLQ